MPYLSPAKILNKCSTRGPVTTIERAINQTKHLTLKIVSTELNLSLCEAAKFYGYYTPLSSPDAINHRIFTEKP